MSCDCCFSIVPLGLQSAPGRGGSSAPSPAAEEARRLAEEDAAAAAAALARARELEAHLAEREARIAAETEAARKAAAEAEAARKGAVEVDAEVALRAVSFGGGGQRACCWVRPHFFARK